MNHTIPEFEIFPNAPIKEAIFEIGFKDINPSRVQELENLHEQFRSSFPEIKPIQAFEKYIALGGDDVPQDRSWVQGYQMWASDNQELLTCRLNGFSYNKLKPYLDGNSAIEKTLNAWDTFSQSIIDIEIDKLAVRNINIFDIPENRFELSDYLKLSPVVPDSLSENDMVGFIVNTVLEFKQQNATCSITLAPQPPSGSGFSILLDIEARKSISKIDKNEDIKNELECLKFIKDKVFFSIITDKAKEMFR